MIQARKLAALSAAVMLTFTAWLYSISTACLLFKSWLGVSSRENATPRGKCTGGCRILGKS